MGIFKEFSSALKDSNENAKANNSSLASKKLLKGYRSEDIPSGLVVEVRHLFYDSNGVVFLVNVAINNSFKVYDVCTGSYYTVLRDMALIPMHILLTILKSNLATVTILGEVSKLENGSIIPQIDYDVNKRSIFCVYEEENAYRSGGLKFSEGNELFAKYPISKMLVGIDIFYNMLKLDKNKAGIVVPKSLVDELNKARMRRKSLQDKRKEVETAKFLIVDNQGICLGLSFRGGYISIPELILALNRGKKMYVPDGELVPDPENSTWKVLVKGAKGGLSSINDSLPKHNIVNTNLMSLRHKVYVVTSFEKYSGKKVSSTIKKALGMIS